MVGLFSRLNQLNEIISFSRPAWHPILHPITQLSVATIATYNHTVETQSNGWFEINFLELLEMHWAWECVVYTKELFPKILYTLFKIYSKPLWKLPAWGWKRIPRRVLDLSPVLRHDVVDVPIESWWPAPWYSRTRSMMTAGIILLRLIKPYWVQLRERITRNA